MTPSGYKLIWEDDFNETSLDTTKWTTRYGKAYIENGNLIFKDDYSSSIKSIPDFLYGYIEFKSKFADTTNKGFCNGLWFINKSYDTIWFEINLAETATGSIDNGNNPYGINKMNLHVHSPVQSSAIGYRYDTNIDLSKDYHLYAIEWTSNYIDFYFDGIVLCRYEPTYSVPMPDIPLEIRISLCRKSLDETDTSECWPTTELGANPGMMYVDYVRVYKLCIQPQCDFIITQ